MRFRINLIVALLIGFGLAVSHASTDQANAVQSVTRVDQSAQLGTAVANQRNAFLADLPPGQWIRIHEQDPNDDVYFERIRHAGSTFDSKRGHLIIFGSDTHDGNDWTNSPLIFDTQKNSWIRLYENDPLDTYHVNSRGHPVAGSAGKHPWAMHTYGSIEYDPVHDRLIISSYPRHLVPGRFTDVVKDVWPLIQSHPTWTFDLSTHTWHPLQSDGVHFFPYATAYDPDRNQIIGYRHSGVFEFSGNPSRWRQVLQAGLMGYHNNAVYDTANKAVVVFGSNENSNKVVVYDTTSKNHKIMPTPGTRPPKDQHVPLAFHPLLKKTVAVVDRVPEGYSWRDRAFTTAETWLYDLASDQWSHVSEATLSFGVGMNYNLVYDSIHNVMLLVTNAPDKPTSVWALNL